MLMAQRDLFGNGPLEVSRRRDSVLAERFLMPPFTVLDTRSGAWQQRKRAWLDLGIQSELGRGDNALGLSAECEDYRTGTNGYAKAPASGLARMSGQDLMRGEHTVGNGKTDRLAPGGTVEPCTVLAGAAGGYAARKDLERQAGQALLDDPLLGGQSAGLSGLNQNQSGTSIFDPVLCELSYRWFCPPGGSVLDPFAGGSVRGIVAACLGLQYTGIDLRPEQVAANTEQAAALVPDNTPRWLVGDAREAGHLAPGSYDFVFTCPPYADLEVYSDDPRDISTMSYAAFLGAYRHIIAVACDLLRPDRFACVVISNVRGQDGCYRDLVAETCQAFAVAGARLYNEAILVNAVGSLAIRVGKQFTSGRKLGKSHQNVLTFVKGDWRKAATACASIEAP